MNASVLAMNGLLVLSFLAGGCGGGDGGPDRPNIIVLLTDDQVTSSLRFMPKTESLLAREGVSFTNFFVNNPICCPSRVTIFTGKYHHNHGIETAPPPSSCGQRFMVDGYHRRAMGKRLQDAGFRTSYIGKLLNRHNRYVDAYGSDEKKGNLLLGWDEYHVLTQNRYYGYTMHEEGKLVRRLRKEALYQTDELERLATEFIYGAIADERPFLLFIATGAPHEPARSAARHARSFEDERAPRVPSFNDPDVSGQPGVANNPLLTGDQIATIDSRYRDHIRALQAVDELTEKLISALTDVARLENTFVFFTSDNGLHFGEHRMFWGKGTPYEEAVRVPFIVRGPGVVGGHHSAQLVTNADIFPTILELSGLHADEAVDGRSIAPLLLSDDDDLAWRTAILLESRHKQRNQGVPPFRAVRTERFKWIEYDDGSTALYDLENDPYEMTNLRDERWEGISKGLSARLRDLSDCEGAACWEIESRPLESEIRSE